MNRLRIMGWAGGAGVSEVLVDGRGHPRRRSQPRIVVEHAARHQVVRRRV